MCVNNPLMFSAITPDIKPKTIATTVHSALAKLVKIAASLPPFALLEPEVILSRSVNPDNQHGIQG